MTTAYPSKRKGASEVAKSLRNAIQNNDFQRYDRLPSERVLSETYGVSRGTIRESLNRLEDEGLVEIRAGSGTYVIFSDSFDGSQIIANARPLELIDTRFALEPHICRLAVLSARRSDFEKLERLVDKMDDVNNIDALSFGELDTQFHSTLVQSTGNSLLIWIISQINSVRGQDQWAQMRKITLDPSIITKYNEQHRAILDAIREREPERAAILMKGHLETARLSLTRAAEA
jgi:GntR family uxuAB operon transcriptional repressor